MSCFNDPTLVRAARAGFFALALQNVMSSRASDTTPGKSTNLNTANCPPSTATAAAALNLQDARVQVALNAVKLELEEVRVAFKDVSSLNGDVQSLRNELAELRRDREEQGEGRVSPTARIN